MRNSVVAALAVLAMTGVVRPVGEPGGPRSQGVCGLDDSSVEAWCVRSYTEL